MIARFGFYNTMWNVGEEVHLYSANYLAATTKYISDLLGDHLDGSIDAIIKVHTLVIRGFGTTTGYEPYNELYPLPGNRMNTTSLQVIFDLTRAVAQNFLTLYPGWRIEVDEIGHIYGSVAYAGLVAENAREKAIRMWGDVLSGVGGVLQYFAYYPDEHGGGDINTSTFSTREEMWNSVNALQDLFATLPIQELQPVWGRFNLANMDYEGPAARATSNDSTVLGFLTNSSHPQAQILVGQNNRCYRRRFYNPRYPEWLGPPRFVRGGQVAIGPVPNIAPSDPSVILFEEVDFSLCP